MPDPAPQGTPATRPQAQQGPSAPGSATRRGTGSRGDPVVQVVRPWAGVGTLVLAVVVGATAYAGSIPVALAVAACAALLTWGWSTLLSLPSPRGSTAVLGVGAVALLVGAASTTSPASPRRVPDAIAIGVIAIFAHQLLRRDGRPRLAIGAAGTCLGLLVLASSVALVPLPSLVDGRYAVLAAMAAVAVCAVVDLAGAPASLRPWRVPVALVLGAAAAGLMGHLGGLHWVPFALLGLLCGAVVAALHRVLAVLPTLAAPRAQAAAAAAPVLLVGVLAYVVSRLFVS